MNIKKYLAGITASILTLLAVGCGRQNAEPPVMAETRNDLIIAVGSEPDEGFDPCAGWGRYGSPLIQSTLLEIDSEMNLIGDLAMDYTVSEDRLQWTFTLREDAFFTDGEPVTADDIAFTFNTAKNSGSIVDLTQMESCISKDNYTVIFTLNQPDSTFAYTIAATGIVPEHAYSPDYGQHPIGSGPFKLLQWDKGQQVILQANENYYGTVPEMKQVTLLFMSEDAALAAAQAGQLDMAVTVCSFADIAIDGMQLIRCESIDNRGLTLPVLPDTGEVTADGYPIGNNVTSDLAIRQALSYGINREMLVEQVLNGYGRPAYTECDGMPWWNPETEVAYDLDKAGDLLENAGWIDSDGDGIREKNGLKAAFTLLYSAGDSTRQALAMATSQQARELGIDISIEGVSWDIIDQRMYSDAVLMGWGAQNPNETYLLYHSNNIGRDYYNPEYYSNPVVDQYINQAMNSADLEESIVYWQKAQWDGNSGIASQGDCPWVWLVNLDHLYFVREGLDIGNQKIHPHGHAWPIIANLKEWSWSI